MGKVRDIYGIFKLYINIIISYNIYDWFKREREREREREKIMY